MYWKFQVGRGEPSGLESFCPAKGELSVCLQIGHPEDQ